MAKEKVTVSVDRSKVRAAGQLLGVDGTSQVIDRALDHCIKSERLRKDIEAYLRVPLTEEELQLARFGALPDLPDDVDWEALFPPAGGG